MKEPDTKEQILAEIFFPTPFFKSLFVAKMNLTSTFISFASPSFLEYSCLKNS